MSGVAHPAEAPTPEGEIVFAWPTILMQGNTHISLGTFVEESPETSTLVRTQMRCVKLVDARFDRQTGDRTEVASNA